MKYAVKSTVSSAMLMRRVLKARLVTQRGQMSELDGTVTDELAMHEVFVQRNHLKGKHNVDRISHECNCVLVTPSQNENMSAEDNNRLKKKLIARYSKEAIQTWVDGLELKVAIVVNDA